MNSWQSIRARYSASGLSWLPVLLFLPARLVFAFVVQGVLAGILALQGVGDPWRASAAWWPIYSTLTDALCLLSLAWLTRREGLGFFDLVGARGKAALRQLAWTPLYLLAVLPGVAVASVFTQAVYASPVPPIVAVVEIAPAWGLYSVVIWPVIWVFAEELTYLGYLFPRLEAWSGKTWLAALAVVFFWGLQHLAIPFLPDGKYLLWRVLSACAAVSLFPVVFAWRRRLVPLIGVHYIADLSTGFLVAAAALGRLNP